MGRTVNHNGILYEDLGNGQARVIGPADAPPMNPEFPYKGPKAAADLNSTQASTQRTAVQTRGDLIDNRVKGATAEAQIAKAKAEAAAAQANADKAARDASSGGRPQLTAGEFANAIQGYRSAEALTNIIADLESKFNNGPGATKGFAGFKDFVGGPANQQFDKAANAARGTVGQALGFIGSQLNSAQEAEINVGPYIPKASDWDGSIKDAIDRLKELQTNARARSVAVLGGVPDANGRITPVPMEQSPNAFLQPYVTEGGMSAAPAGSETKQYPIPRAMQDEYNAFLSKGPGRFTADEYAAFRAGLDAKYGFPTDPTKFQAYRDEAERFKAAASSGGTINTRIPGPQRKMSTLDQFRNDAVNSPVGGAAAGYLDSVGFGGVQALLPEQMQALGDSQGLPMALGQIGGAITGTNLVGKGGASVARKFAPRLLGGGKGAQFARNLAADTAYGGTYGGVSQGDPLTGAMAGAGGSGAGQIVGKGLGRAVGGIDLSPMAQKLADAQIPLTAGQTLGGVFKSIEDAATSIPGIGDMINARRLDGLRQWNSAAFSEAGSPVRATTQNLGELGVQDLVDQISSSYDNATQGVRVPIDPQFAQDIAAARQAGQRLPGDLASRSAAAFDNRVDPALSSGELTGEGYQQAVRGLKSYRAEANKPGFEQDYRDVLGRGIDALTGQMQRGGGDQVVQGLESANEAYKRTKVLQRAVQAAKNGSGSGEIQVFSPAQLNTAATQAANKFGGQRPLADLIDAGQSVLPSKIPDSGTGRRLMQALPLAGLTTAGAGAGALSGDAADGAKGGLALGALLTLGGTKGGQAVINTLLTKRAPKLRTAGRAISKRSRQLGAAAIPLLLDTTK
jgi:hypothetical protein